jgi:hypothetical protein
MTNKDKTTHHNFCRQCGVEVDLRRWALGYKFCLDCGDVVAKQVKFTVVPMHKSNYVCITNMSDLIGINNKGGLVK